MLQMRNKNYDSQRAFLNTIFHTSRNILPYLQERGRGRFFVKPGQNIGSRRRINLTTSILSLGGFSGDTPGLI